MPEPSFRKGESVYVFYRAEHMCRPSRRYLAMLDLRHGAWRPRMGLQDGWVPGVVVEDCVQEGGQVVVDYAWPHFFTSQGNLADTGCPAWFDTSDVKRPSDFSAAPSPSAGLPMNPAGSVPDLAIINFRWGGQNEVRAPDQWGSTGSPVSEKFLDAFVEHCVEPRLGTSYEIWTVYVENCIDLNKVADCAHLIFGPNHPARRARRTCAMYFLYPTGFEENCIPTRETGEDGGAALVDQKSLFKMMKAVERAGVPTHFPHPSGFYELVTSKRWTAMMSLVPHLRVPPTVALPRDLIERSPAEAAAKALAALTECRNQQYALRNEPRPSTDIAKGVAKLGFSWEALDVKFWEGLNGLQQAIYQLTQTIVISEEYTGQPHDLESVMIQEYCPHDLELRLYVVDGEVEASIYTKFCSVKENNEFGDFKESFEAEDAASQWMNGDVKTLLDGERQCKEVVNHWLAWIKTQICDVPPAIRFDFFVGRSAKAGVATIWTLEICELGFSMLGHEELPAKVFDAMLRSCLGAEVSPVPQADKKKKKKPKQSPAVADPVSPTSSVEHGEKALPVAEDNGASDSKFIYVCVPDSPDGTPDQASCTGKYAICEGRRANNMPLWKHTRGDRWMYFGDDNHWYIGDEEEEGLNFECNQGYIRQARRGQLLPHELPGAWARGPNWDADRTITVTSGQSPPPATAGAKNGKGKSKKKSKGKA